MQLPRTILTIASLSLLLTGILHAMEPEGACHVPALRPEAIELAHGIELKKCTVSTEDGNRESIIRLCQLDHDRQHIFILGEHTTNEEVYVPRIVYSRGNLIGAGLSHCGRFLTVSTDGTTNGTDTAKVCTDLFRVGDLFSSATPEPICSHEYAAATLILAGRTLIERIGVAVPQSHDAAWLVRQQNPLGHQVYDIFSFHTEHSPADPPHAIHISDSRGIVLDQLLNLLPTPPTNSSSPQATGHPYTTLQKRVTQLARESCATREARWQLLANTKQRVSKGKRT